MDKRLENEGGGEAVREMLVSIRRTLVDDIVERGGDERVRHE